MPALKRFKTKYPGVVYVEGTYPATGKPERIYYIRYRKDGKQIEEKAGRQFQDDMSASRANLKRLEKIKGDELPNQKRREVERAEQEKQTWTIARLWFEYTATNPGVKAIGRDEDRFNCYLRWELGDREPKDLVPMDMDRIRVRLQKKLKPATVRNVLELLRRLINFGVKKQLCQGINFRMQMPVVHNLKTEDLSSDQLGRLLDEIVQESDIQAANLMRMALYSGMRRGELFKLQWEHVDFDRGFINIVDPKGGPSQKIPLNQAARNVLENHPRIDEYVFPGSKGQRVDTPQAVEKIKERAELPKDFRPMQGLRHVYASMLASSGEVDMYTLQKLLTHKSPMMTKRYAHLRDETLKRASDLAGDLISQAANGKSYEKVVNLTVVE
jgi:integrase